MVKKERPFNQDIQDIIAIHKKRERQRAVEIMEVLRKYEATVLFPFVVTEGVPGILKGLARYGMLDQTSLAAYLTSEIKQIEKAYA